MPKAVTGIVTRASGPYKRKNRRRKRIRRYRHAHAIFPGGLRCVYSRVGGNDEVRWNGGVDGECCDADTAGKERRLIVKSHQFRQHRQGHDAVSEPLGGAERAFHRSIRKDQRKFFSAIAGCEIAGSRNTPARALLAVQQPA